MCEEHASQIHAYQPVLRLSYFTLLLRTANTNHHVSYDTVNYTVCRTHIIQYHTVYTYTVYAVSYCFEYIIVE